VSKVLGKNGENEKRTLSSIIGIFYSQPGEKKKRSRKAYKEEEKPQNGSKERGRGGEP